MTVVVEAETLNARSPLKGTWWIHIAVMIVWVSV